MEQFIEELGRILQSAQVSVVPGQLANIKGFFEGMSQVSANVTAPPTGKRRARRMALEVEEAEEAEEAT